VPPVSSTSLFKFRDPVSGGLHLLGAVLGAIGAAVLLVAGIRRGTSTHVIAFAIFGASLVLLYASSAAYHLLDVSEKARQVFRRIDHSMIFVLIAGSYTPFALLVLEGPLSFGLLVALWSLTVVGLVKKVFWIHAPRGLSTGLYLLMGWSALLVAVPLARSLSLWGMRWLVAGGVAYSVGAIVYATKRPDPFPNVFGFHEIWHLFVLLGSACHFLSVATLMP
jgi:hemolysin III